MNIDYFLFCKEKYNEMVKYLEAVNNIYDELITVTNETNQIPYNNIDLIWPSPNELTELKLRHEKRIQHMKNFEQYYKSQLKMLCEHTYVDDFIDIDPDTSQKITYCTICDTTKI